MNTFSPELLWEKGWKWPDNVWIVSEDLMVVLNDELQPVAKSFNPWILFDNISSSPDILRLIFEIFHLKNIYRRWWTLSWRDIQLWKCESVADHCFWVAVVALFVANEYFPQLDLNKVVLMWLLHELGEIYAWDIAPRDNVSKEDKFEREKSWVLNLLKGFSHYQKYYEIWLEFEQWLTAEAKFVKQIDKLEMIIQSAIYAGTYDKPQLIEFFNRAFPTLNDTQIRNLAECLLPIYETV